MISTNKMYKYARLDARIVNIENYYVGWRQYVRVDGTLVNLGTFIFQKRTSHGWDAILKDRIVNAQYEKYNKVGSEEDEIEKVKVPRIGGMKVRHSNIK